MKNRTFRRAVELCLGITFGTSLSCCTNSDFDLSNIDSTIGIGGESLSLPSNNSTEKIKLDNVLKLDNSDCVKILENGDYAFVKSDDNVSPAHPFVDKVKVSSGKTTPIIYNLFNQTRALTQTRATSMSLDFAGSIVAFDYKYSSVPSEILEMQQADANSQFTLTINFSDEIKKNISTFKTLSLALPQFLQIASITSNGAPVAFPGNKVSLSNISTGNSLTIIIQVKGLDFTAAETTNKNNVLKFTKNTSISVQGYVDISGTFDVETANLLTVNKNNCYINANMAMTDFTITGATGKFNPSISFSNIGNVTLNNIPDFLSDKDVNIDLYNPQIDLNLTSDLPLKGLVSGTLVSKYDNGKSDVSVTIPQFSVKANDSGSTSTTTKVCICKNKADFIAKNPNTYGNYEIVEVPNLSDIVKVIPKSITFNATAKADETETSSIALGKQYTIQPQYSMHAPLAFTEKASIVYRDTLDGWNDDLKKLSLSEGGYIQVSASAVNQVPVYLTLSAYAIDTNGIQISSGEITIDVDKTIAASSNGTAAATTAVTIKITPKNTSVFKKLNGIVFKAVGAASDGKSPVSGITINAYNQTLTFNNVKAQIVGKIIGDFN